MSRVVNQEVIGDKCGNRLVRNREKGTWMRVTKRHKELIPNTR